MQKQLGFESYQIMMICVFSSRQFRLATRYNHQMFALITALKMYIIEWGCAGGGGVGGGGREGGGATKLIGSRTKSLGLLLLYMFHKVMIDLVLYDSLRFINSGGPHFNRRGY